jgi:hypothetical protein
MIINIAYVCAFSLIIIGLFWGRLKAMYVFAAPVLLLILSKFMDIKHIYATAVNPSILTATAIITLTGVLKTPPFHRIIDLLGNSARGILIKSSQITARLPCRPSFIYAYSDFFLMMTHRINGSRDNSGEKV